MTVLNLEASTIVRILYTLPTKLLGLNVLISFAQAHDNNIQTFLNKTFLVESK